MIVHCDTEHEKPHWSETMSKDAFTHAGRAAPEPLLISWTCKTCSR